VSRYVVSPEVRGFVTADWLIQAHPFSALATSAGLHCTAARRLNCEAMTKDWLAWHEPYQDERSPLSRRLRAVQQQVRRVLPRMLDGAFTAVSLCAGQGDDLIGVLNDYSQASLVRGRLVEIDERNIERMRTKARAAGLTHLEIIRGDASDASLFEGLVPADLVLLCGIFGNIAEQDVLRTIGAMPQFCKGGGTVIWTRSRRDPDFTPVIRSAFREAGFAETAFIAPADVLFSVGACRFEGQPQDLQPGRLFTFKSAVELTGKGGAGWKEKAAGSMPDD
jgi:hypothetical protein